jgi:hypothetical protein
VLRRLKPLDEQACLKALYGGPREVHAEPLTRKADPKRTGERIRERFEQRLSEREEEEAA